VVGSDKSAEAPPGVSVASELFHEDVAILGTTLSGLTGLSERSGRRSGVSGSPRPPRRLHDREAFRRSACRAIRRSPGGSRRLRLPLRVRAPSPSPVRQGPDRPSWGSVPLQRLQRRDPVHPGLPRPGTFRPRGFSPPRRVALPPAWWTRWVHCRSWGSHSSGSFERQGRGASPHPSCPLVRGALQSRTLRNTRSRAPQPPRHLSSCALVPRPWFQSRQAPFEAHHPRAVAGAFAPAGPLTCSSPRRLGEP